MAANPKSRPDSHPEIRIERAGPDDREAVLRVMRPWNMHHVPSPEMAELDLGCFFVARLDGEIIGAGGYRILSATEGKTTLLGVLPEFADLHVGVLLQEARLQAMLDAGVRTVTTNADRPSVIRWYKMLFGYREVGKLAKLHSFGHPDIDHWTTLRLDLEAYKRKRQGIGRAAGDPRIHHAAQAIFQ
jgi:ribosomal-protein-alanine N-acetyltransferase